MTKAESLRRFTLERYLILSLGFTADEAATLRRISNTLRRWHELECGNDSGVIERDEATGKPYWVNYHSRYLSTNDPRSRSRIADREAGALRRLVKIMRDVNERRFVGDVASTLNAHCDDLNTYIQTDPRGAALYILRPGDIPAGSKVESCYTNGVCVY
jgi:hypothetical protein